MGALIPPSTLVAPRQPAALRFLTAGSVDDGKSTLIGRLLMDSRSILADQLHSLERRAQGAPLDLSLLTDGLEAEREQGITIDVAYRYFATPERKFIIADAPGHEQYTRNMVTAASNSDAVVVLVDATKLSGPDFNLLPQTRRHALLSHLLRVPHLVFAVNKLDALPSEHTETTFTAIARVLESFAQQAGLPLRGIVPVSALRGDNVLQPSSVWTWYQGPALLTLLHTLPSLVELEGDNAAQGNVRLAVQLVTREDALDQEPGAGVQHRVLWGHLSQGSLRPGDTVHLWPSAQQAKVLRLRRSGRAVSDATAGQSIGVVLDRPLDASRGDWLLGSAAAPLSNFTGTLAWLDTEPAVVGRKYWLRHGHRWVHARISAVRSVLDIHTLRHQDGQSLATNAIGTVEIQSSEPLPLLPYHQHRASGALIVVDPTTHRTSGALLVAEPT